jgi:hypothetical protein
MVQTAAGVYGIITDNSANWDDAYGWGDHSQEGYLTAETSHSDVVVDGDFTANGVLKRTAAGTYGVVADSVGLKTFWNGTAAQYTAIGAGNYDANTIYFVNV